MAIPTDNGIDLEMQIYAASKVGQDFHIPAGVYPAFYQRNTTPAAPMKITADKGVVLKGIVTQNSANLVFSGLEVLQDPSQGQAISIQGGHDIHIDSCNLHGQTPNDGYGAVRAMNSPGFQLTNSELHHASGGVQISGCTGVIIGGNSFHDIEVDGVQSTASSHVTVSNNKFADFYPKTGDHSDAIQFLTTGQTAPATDILVSGNVVQRGNGQPIQGVFMGNEAAIPYQNVMISGNAVVGGVYQGIALGLCSSGTITDNLVQAYADQGSWINADSANIAVTNNQTTSLIIQGQSITAPANGNVLLKPVAVGDTSALAKWQARGASPVPTASTSTVPVAPLEITLQRGQTIIVHAPS